MANPNTNLNQKLAKVSQQLSQWLAGPSLASAVLSTQQQAQKASIDAANARSKVAGQFNAFSPKAEQSAPSQPSQQSLIGQMIKQLQSGQQQPSIQNLIDSSSANIIGDLIAGSVEKALSKLSDLELTVKAHGGDPTAMAQFAVKKEQQSKRNQSEWNQIGANLAQPLMRQPMGGTPEGTIGRSSKWVKDFSEGMQKLGGPLTGSLGSVLKGFGTFGTVLASVTAAGHEMQAERHGKDQSYAQFSGAMAQVMAEKEVRDIRLAKIYGDALAPSSRGREEAISQLKSTWAPIGIGLSKLGDDLIKVGANVATFALQALGAAPMNPPVDQQGMAVWFSNIENTTWASVYGLPPGIMPNAPVNVVGQQP